MESVSVSRRCDPSSYTYRDQCNSFQKASSTQISWGIFLCDSFVGILSACSHIWKSLLIWPCNKFDCNRSAVQDPWRSHLLVHSQLLSGGVFRESSYSSPEVFILERLLLLLLFMLNSQLHHSLPCSWSTLLTDNNCLWLGLSHYGCLYPMYRLYRHLFLKPWQVQCNQLLWLWTGHHMRRLHPSQTTYSSNEGSLMCLSWPLVICSA